MAIQVTARDGSRWVVGRHWAPRIGNETVWGRFTRRFGKMSNATDVADPGGWLSLPDEGIGAAIGILVVVLALAFFGVPLVLAVIDVAVVLLLAVLGVLGRLLLRRPWTVGASRMDGKGSAEWRVAGWRASRELIEDVAGRLDRGEPLPPHGGRSAI